MEDIKQLLKKVTEATPEGLSKRIKKHDDFNVFRLCGVDHYETANSKIIAELLNPQGSLAYHGGIFLDMFLAHLGRPENFDIETARVYTEYIIDEGRIDILIEDDQGKAIIIENKIYAADQPEQLKRYNEFGKRKYGKGNYRILYLTLYGEEATKQSCGGDDYELDYLPISYEKHILGWLVFMANMLQEDESVAPILRHYSEHIKQLAIQGMNAQEKQKIANMISADPEMMESANRVYEAWDFCKQNVMSKLVDTIERVAKEFELEYNVDPDFKMGKFGSYVKLFKKSWDFTLLFYFADNNHFLDFGIDHLDNGNRCHAERANLLKKLLMGDFATDKGNWIAVQGVKEWNENRWAKWVGNEGEQELETFVHERVKKMLNVLATKNL